jgi:predicted dinucleotide-binding enzyme
MSLKIGIVGAGMIGATLARLLVANGHYVELSNSRNPETLEKEALETGSKAVFAADAVKNKDIVVVTVQQKSVPSLKEIFAAVPKETIVIDTNNYYPGRDGSIDAIEKGQTESAWVAEQIGHAVIKVFNNISFLALQSEGRPKNDKNRIALPVAGDDGAQKKRVIELVDSIGFDAFDAGSIADSYRQQPGSPIYCTDYHLERAKDAWQGADKERKFFNQRRDAGLAKVMELFKSQVPMENPIKTLVNEVRIIYDPRE